LCNYTILRWVRLHNFEFNCPHASADKESIAFADRSISYRNRGSETRTSQKGARLLALEEIWLDVYIEDIAAQTLNGVIEGKNVYALPIFDVKALVDIHKVAKLDAKVITCNLVHLYAAFLDIVRAQTDEHCVSPFLSAEVMCKTRAEVPKSQRRTGQ
jgi:hypothetical protein